MSNYKIGWKFILISLIALCGLSCIGQTTTVTATITDSDGQTWNNGQWKATLYNPQYPNGPFYLDGVKLTSSQIQASGNMNSSGVISTTLYDVINHITPGGTYYQFTLVPNASAGTVQGIGASPTGSSIDLSTTLSNNLAGPRFPNTPGAYGYSSIEINPTPNPGAIFTITASVPYTQCYWNGSGGCVQVGTTSGSLWRSSMAASSVNWYNQPSLNPAPAWASGTAYNAGQIVINGGNLYICAVAGTSAGSGGPTGTALTAITDNTVSWLFWGVPSTTATSPNAPVLTQSTSAPGAPLTQFWAAALNDFVTVNPYFSYPGATPVASRNGGDGLSQVRAEVSYYSASGVQTLADQGTVILFRTSAPKFAVELSGNFASIQFAINGQLASPSVWTAFGGGGNIYETFDFTSSGGRIERTVAIYGAAGLQQLRGVYTDTASTVHPVAGPSVDACIFGDSFTQGGGSGAYASPYLSLGEWYNPAFAQLGFVPSLFAVGGTGYVTRNGGNNNVNDLLTYAPNQARLKQCTAFIFAVGINDVPTGLQAAALQAFQTARLLVPSAPIIVYGPLGSSSGTNIVANENAISAAVTQFGDPNTYFVPTATATPPFMSGTGNVTAPSGSGNADSCMGNASHPTQPCQYYQMSGWMTATLRQIIQKIP